LRFTDANSFDSRADYDAYWNARFAIRRSDRSEVAPDGGSIKWTDLHGRIYPLYQEIAELPAETLAGLGIQARAFS
jgi:hypothetical protein